MTDTNKQLAIETKYPRPLAQEHKHLNTLYDNMYIVKKLVIIIATHFHAYVLLLYIGSYYFI